MDQTIFLNQHNIRLKKKLKDDLHHHQYAQIQELHVYYFDSRHPNLARLDNHLIYRIQRLYSLLQSKLLFLKNLSLIHI